MRTLFLTTYLWLLLPVGCLAQDTPKVEVFGGYSYFRADEEDFPQDDRHLHGWEASANFNINKWLGVKGDVSGHYANYQISPGVKADLGLHMFLGGLQFTSYKSEKVTPYVHALAGVARRSDRVSQANNAIGLTENAFALVLGGGLDVKLTKAWVLRAIQADYVFTTFQKQDFRDDRQHSMRLSVGIVRKFGEQ